MKNLTTERTRRSIGSRVRYCHACSGVISYRDGTPFCRQCYRPVAAERESRRGRGGCGMGVESSQHVIKKEELWKI